MKLLRSCAADHPAVMNASALVQAMRKARLLYSPAPGWLRLTHVAVIDHWQQAKEWYEDDQKHQLTLVSLTEDAKAWSKAGAPGQTGRLVTEAEDLDALQDLWWEWYDDRDRLPLDFMRKSIKAAFDPVARPESWKRHDGSSRFRAIVGSNDNELLAHATSALERLPTEKRQEIINFASPKSGSTALMSAAWRGNERSTKWLIKEGADVNARDDQQWTPLHWAALNGHEAAVQALLAAGAEVNARTEEQATPLHWAAFNGHEATVQALLPAGADVNARGDQQWTPLHAATFNRHEAAAQALLAAGADVNARGQYSISPLTIALALHRMPIISLLIAAGGDLAFASQSQAAWFADPDLSIDDIVDRADVELTEESFAVLRERINTAGVKDFDGFVAFLTCKAAALGGNADAAIAKLKAGAAADEAGNAAPPPVAATDDAPSRFPKS